MSAWRLAACWLLLALLPCVAHAAQVQATLDRDSVALGQTVTLNVRVLDASSGVAAPDFSALQADFEILGSSQNRSVGIVNGVRQSELTFGVALRPRHVGTLEIPALAVAGSRTAPLTLQVTPAAAEPDDANAQADVFVEVQAEPRQVYVGQQVSVVVRLFYAVNLGGALDSPQVDGAQTIKVGDDLKYTAQRGGRSLQVLERRFALVPQRAGRLRIPPLAFQGEVSDPYDPGSFFGPSTPVSARSAAVDVSVQPAPAAAGTDAWLPARALTLTMDGLDSSQPLRVGQPLNLSLTLRATGLPADALPLPTLPALDGATVYPDKWADTTGNSGPWLLGTRQRGFAVVPERAGKLVIPALRVRWWNVLTDRAEVAQIPPRELTVLPAVGASSAPAQPSGRAAPTAVPAPASSKSWPSGPVPWRWLALGSLGLWLASVLAWWLMRRRRAAVVVVPLATDSIRAQRQAFRDAARGSDVAAQTHALLAWARAERPSIRDLGDLAAALTDPAQHAAIAALQRRRYAAMENERDRLAPALASAFHRGFVWRVDDHAPPPVVPPLYPFKLR
jgi:hypothetical protein